MTRINEELANSWIPRDRIKGELIIHPGLYHGLYIPSLRDSVFHRDIYSTDMPLLTELGLFLGFVVYYSDKKGPPEFPIKVRSLEVHRTRSPVRGGISVEKIDDVGAESCRDGI